MFEARYPTGNVRPKPQVVLDKRFPFAREMELGEIGQLDGSIEVDSIRLEMDEDGNEMKVLGVILKDAKTIMDRDKRYA